MRSWRRRSWLGGAVVLSLVLAAGCGRIETRDRALRLSDETNAYAKALRWNEFDEARRFLAKREGEARPVASGFLDRIRVTRAEITSRIMAPDRTEAAVGLRVSYYHVDVGHVVVITESQRWWYRPELRIWSLDGDLPDFAAGLQRRKKP